MINLDSQLPRHSVSISGIVSDDHGRVLLIRRRDNQRWEPPGGILELGESIHDGLRREVREETGLEIEPLGVFEIFERIMRDAAGVAEYHYVLIDYICRVSGGTLCAGDDVCCVQWIAPEALKDLEITEGTLAVIEKAFRKRRRYKVTI